MINLIVIFYNIIMYFILMLMFLLGQIRKKNQGGKHSGKAKKQMGNFYRGMDHYLLQRIFCYI